MGKAVDRIVKDIAANIVPKYGSQTKKQAAIRVAKSKGLVKQRGRHLAAGSKLKKSRRRT